VARPCLLPQQNHRSAGKWRPSKLAVRSGVAGITNGKKWDFAVIEGNRAERQHPLEPVVPLLTLPAISQA
jgi:hypothetical protein